MVTSVVSGLMKQFLKNIVSGKLGDMMKMRTPAFIHSPATYLDCIKYEFTYLEEMLILCKKNGKIEDSVERLKYISTAQLACIHAAVVNQGLRSPLNPVIGETSCFITQNGSTVYLE